MRLSSKEEEREDNHDPIAEFLKKPSTRSEGKRSRFVEFGGNLTRLPLELLSLGF